MLIIPVIDLIYQKGYLLGHVSATHIYSCLLAIILTLAVLCSIMYRPKKSFMRLGAGTIIRSKEGIVKGLTTAASVWVSAAIGLAVGSGYISAALIATVISYLTLSYLKKIEKEIID